MTSDPSHSRCVVMTSEQERFASLHADCLVTQWRWIFQGASLRAVTDRGEAATISRAGVESLIAAGLCEWYDGPECAGVRLTHQSRKAVA